MRKAKVKINVSNHYRKGCRAKYDGSGWVCDCAAKHLQDCEYPVNDPTDPLDSALPEPPK